MRGCIKFDNGDVLWFSESNYREVVHLLTDNQKHQLAELLRRRLGDRNPLPVDVDPDAYQAWYEDTHRKDVMLGGGSGAESAKINRKGGKKYSFKDWQSKGDSDRNVYWLRNAGFRKRWDNSVGYRYIHRDGAEVDPTMIGRLDHDQFKIMVLGLFPKEE